MCIFKGQIRESQEAAFPPEKRCPQFYRDIFTSVRGVLSLVPERRIVGRGFSLSCSRPRGCDSKLRALSKRIIAAPPPGFQAGLYSSSFSSVPASADFPDHFRKDAVQVTDNPVVRDIEDQRPGVFVD